MDNTTVYVLMDTTTDPFRRIASMAYFGTYASGKLLAGSVLGYSCEASVPTWFTDSPTTCPVPCWYDCLKCPTGAAYCEVAAPDCLGETGHGNAQVVWFQNGTLALRWHRHLYTYSGLRRREPLVGTLTPQRLGYPQR